MAASVPGKGGGDHRKAVCFDAPFLLDSTTSTLVTTPRQGEYDVQGNDAVIFNGTDSPKQLL